MSYEQDREDYEYLDTIAEVSDMVVIDAAVLDLMRNPTKSKAAEMYRSAIALWFAEHEDTYNDDERVAEIASERGY